jgi:hypothetical protein
VPPPPAILARLAVPVKLLQESLGHVITVELKTGQTYRGKLADGACRSLLRVEELPRELQISLGEGEGMAVA